MNRSMDPRADWLVADELAPTLAGGLAPLYTAAAKGRLAMPFCGSCSAVLELDQDVCDECGSDRVTWRDVTPVGTVHSVTRVHRREPSLIRTDIPYYVLDVELDSQHRLVMTTTRPVQGPIRIGDRVAIGFRTVGGVTVPAADVERPSPQDTPTEAIP
jgi:uncharacterized OB-fold protein